MLARWTEIWVEMGPKADFAGVRLIRMALPRGGFLAAFELTKDAQ
jgi:hypothetical protein